MANVLEILIRARDEASAAISGLGDTIQKNADTLRKVGAGVTAFGVGMTAALGMATKSALEEQIGISQLSNQLQAVGADYANLSAEIEKNIAATQRKTSFGDEEQRKALTQLVGITGSYEGALNQLQIATDLAAAKGMDLNTAAMLVGRVATGNTSVLSRYGIQIKEGATATEALAIMQGRFAGAAEAAADPTKQLANLWGDFTQDIGKNLLPVLRDFVASVTPIIDSISAWVKEHPELARQLTILAAVLGVVATVVGPLLILLPTLAATFTLLMGPVGIIILAVVALIAIGTLLVMNWGTISAKATEIWGGIASFFSRTWDNIVGFFRDNWRTIVAILFPAVGVPLMLMQNWEPIVEFFKGLWKKVTEGFTSAWEGIVGIIKNSMNSILGFINAMIAGFEAGLNAIGSALRSIPSFTVPDWVPGIGGKTFSVPAPPVITLPRIPLLDTGGLVQGPGLFAVGPGVKEVVRSGNSGMTIGNLNIYAGTREGGQAAAAGFTEELQRRGIKLSGVFA